MKKYTITLFIIISFLFTGIAHADQQSDRDILIRSLIQVLLQQVQLLQQQLQQLLSQQASVVTTQVETPQRVITPLSDQSPPFPVQQTQQPIQISQPEQQIPVKNHFIATVSESIDLNSTAYKISANKEFTIIDLSVNGCGQDSSAIVFFKKFVTVTKLRMDYKSFGTQGEYCSLSNWEKINGTTQFHANIDYYIFWLANIKIKSEDGEIWEFNQGFK